MSNTDPLLSGFFSVADAARLVGASPQRMRGWLNGYRGSNSGPIVDRDFSDTRTVSFLDLMELRFVAFFRHQGVSMPTLRRAASKARSEWGVHHPLALSPRRYVTDRKRIFARSAEEERDLETYDLVTGQGEMWTIMEQTVEEGVEFDTKTYLARTWYPRFAEFPKVVIDPRVAFGRPTIHGTGIPTSVIFRQFKAEKEVDRVAKWFKISSQDANIAIRYEMVAA